MADDRMIGAQIRAHATCGLEDVDVLTGVFAPYDKLRSFTLRCEA